MKGEEIVRGKRHTLHGLNFYMSFFDEVAKLLKKEEKAFVVGGWVRDRILGEEVGKKVDIDLLIYGDAERVAKEFAKRFGGNFFVFEKKGIFIKRNKVLSVIIREGPYRYRFDFSPLEGKDLEKALEEDLRERDFTANAIAVDLDDTLSLSVRQTLLYDPTGGVEDLQRGILRPISLENLKRDPVRILRGFRISVEKGLELTEEFLSFCRENANLLKKSPPERISYELLKILSNPNSYKVVKKIYEVGILEVIIPEFSKLRELLNLDEHSLGVLKELEEALKEGLPFKVGEKTFLGEFSDIELTKLASLLHDISKPDTFKRLGEKITFYNHDKLGEEVSKRICKRLRLGEEAQNFVSKIVRHHLRPFFLLKSKKRGELTKRGMYRFLKDCEEILENLFLHAVADSRSYGDRKTQRELIELYKEVIGFKEELKKTSPKPILNGYEIMKILNLKPSPLVGKIKKELELAQVEGRVKSKEEAINFIKSLLKGLQGEHQQRL